jgi:hypothetical protein
MHAEGQTLRAEMHRSLGRFAHARRRSAGEAPVFQFSKRPKPQRADARREVHPRAGARYRKPPSFEE